MSERNAKKKKKAQQVDVVARKKGNPLFTTIMVLVLIAVLGLGVYAVVSNITPKQEQTTEPAVQDVASYLGEKGITLDEFKTEYGLGDDVTEETELSAAVGAMTVENYAKFSDMSIDAIKEENGMGAEVTNDMIWSEAQEYMPIGVYFEKMGVDYTQILNMYGLSESDLSKDTIMKDAQPILEEAAQKAQASSDETESSETEEPVEEPAE